MKSAVLLLAHGSPDSPEDVPCFLHAVTGGRELPQRVIDEVKHRYTLIGRSPLRDWTTKQAAAVECKLDTPVYFAMRNWTPYIREVVARMQADGIEHVVAIPLAPQNSRTSTGLYRKALLGAEDTAPFTCDFVESWHNHPQLIEAFAERFRAGYETASREYGAPLPVIFTAHSVPTGTITEGDPYEHQARETAALVAAAVGLNGFQWTFAFQSQGMSGGSWLGPTVEETIEGLRAAGASGVFIQPIGFLCDHIEVLYDIDMYFKRFAAERGMKLWRTESLNDSPLLAEAVSSLARERLATPISK